MRSWTPCVRMASRTSTCRSHRSGSGPRSTARRDWGGEGTLIPAAFEYFAPQSVSEAIGLLEKHGDDAKLLAGGQSLLTFLKLRMGQAEVIVRLRQMGWVDGG